MRVRDPGFALIIVLLAVSVIFALAIRSAVATRTGAIEVSAVRDRERCEREARAAVVIALKGLLPTGKIKDSTATSGGAVEDSTPSFAESPGGGAGAEDKIPELPDELKGISAFEKIGEQAKQDQESRVAGALRITQGAQVLGARPKSGIMRTLRSVGLPTEPVTVKVNGTSYEIEMRDASGLLDINSAKRDVLVRYFGAVGLTSGLAGDLASQIVDWRDSDSVQESSGGAEQGAYDREGIRCRNAPFDSLEELLFLPSMTHEIFDRIKVDLCLAGPGLVHVGSASKEVLLALPGSSADVAERILRARSEGPITEQILDEIIPRNLNTQLRSSIKADPSNTFTVRVRALDEATGRPVASFRGVAVVTDEGVRAVGVRAL